MRTLIRAGRLIDGTGGPPRDDAGLVIEDEKIAFVGSEGEAEQRCQQPDLEIDARDKTVIPGLVDGHCHIIGTWAQHAPSFEGSHEALVLWGAGAAPVILAAGITAVGDCGAHAGLTLALRAAIDAGQIAGPHLICSGPAITTTAGHGDYIGISVLADNADQLRQQIRNWVRAGVDFIKIMATGGSLDPPSNRRRAQYSRAELAAAAEDAHRLQKRVVTHCNGTEGIRNSVEAGIDVIAHCNWLGTEPGVVEYDDALAERMGAQGTMVDLNGGGLGQLVPGEGNVVGWPNGELPPRRWEIIDRMRRVHGVRAYLTTDGANKGIARFPELLCRIAHETQLTPIEIIHMATQLPAIGIGAGHRIGTLEEGKTADVLLLDGDPLADFRAITRVQKVIKNGKVAVDGGRLIV